MKKIVFLNVQKNKALLFLFVLILVLFFVNFVLWQNKYLRVSFYLFLTIYLSKMFWFRNYFEWNKMGFLIKINSFFGKNYMVSDIQTIVFQFDGVKIIKNNGNEKTFCLKHITAESKQRLFDILKSYKGITFISAE
ncbi:hypothetical protein CGC56_08815 [Capnocytophaga canimorsus]|uniref:Uncharacterized protein n=4 Tax=Capnocytophaga canimorsus TaxID=28188 RepID=F9YR74_CAPCC|nr:Hypothetical protein Ccan_03100 [Capnocytophaga canimorsus Cc5]ATA92246.1 hypothetical protein CGC56_08815 [Capnocytophaga canimorsus]